MPFDSISSCTSPPPTNLASHIKSEPFDHKNNGAHCKWSRSGPALPHQSITASLAPSFLTITSARRSCVPLCCFYPSSFCALAFVYAPFKMSDLDAGLYGGESHSLVGNLRHPIPPPQIHPRPPPTTDANCAYSYLETLVKCAVGFGL